MILRTSRKLNSDVGGRTDWWLVQTNLSSGSDSDGGEASPAPHHQPPVTATVGCLPIHLSCQWLDLTQNYQLPKISIRGTPRKRNKHITLRSRERKRSKKSKKGKALTLILNRLEHFLVEPHCHCLSHHMEQGTSSWGLRLCQVWMGYRQSGNTYKLFRSSKDSLKVCRNHHLDLFLNPFSPS